MEIAKRYEIGFLEMGTDKNHVYFLVQSVPTYNPTKIVKMVKGITAREILPRGPVVDQQLWGGAFGFKGYLISQVGPHGQ